MDKSDKMEIEELLALLKEKATRDQIRVTQHAQQEMVDEGIALNEVIEAISNGEILENYPEHRRGACCLVNGKTQTGRPIHAVCTTSSSIIILVTVYVPMPPKWLSPTQRRPK